MRIEKIGQYTRTLLFMINLHIVLMVIMTMVLLIFNIPHNWHKCIYPKVIEVAAMLMCMDLYIPLQHFYF